MISKVAETRQATAVGGSRWQVSVYLRTAHSRFSTVHRKGDPLTNFFADTHEQNTSQTFRLSVHEPIPSPSSSLYTTAFHIATKTCTEKPRHSLLQGIDI